MNDKVSTQSADVVAEKIGYLSQQGSNNINKSLTEFSKKSNELVRDVLKELEKSKNLIV